MRAFIAVTLPDDIRASLSAVQGQLAASAADVKWVAGDALHVTLKFLGEITDGQRQAVEDMLRHVAGGVAPFEMRLAGVGAFPSVAAPRVVWVGIVEGREALSQLADAIEREREPLRLPGERRPFAAHVTLGRVRSPTRRQVLTEQLRAAAWHPPAPWRVTSLALYQSTLTPSGPTYTVLATIPLASHAVHSP